MDNKRKPNDGVDRLTAEEAEAERLYQLQKTQLNRKLQGNVDPLAASKAEEEEAERLATQEAEAERLYQLQKTQVNRKVKEEVEQATTPRAMPVERETRTVSTSPAKPTKKKSSWGFVIGIVVVVVLAIARTGFNVISNIVSSNSPVDNPAIEAPVVVNPATEAPVVANPPTKAPVVANPPTQAPAVVQSTATNPPPAAQEPTLTLSKNAYCRKSPSPEAEDVTAFLKGDNFPIIAQDSDGWWLVKINIPQISRRKACWIYGEGHTLKGNYSSMPFKEDFEVGPEYNPP